jgi:leucyl/phenylalanyl-tRNA--protein transferase
MIPWLDAEDDHTPFPDPATALSEPDGLLAAGGSLRPLRLLNAYRNGIFPWYNPGEPILWWSPSQRAVIYPDQIHISRSLQRTLRKTPFTFTQNTAFCDVMLGCAAPRGSSNASWITIEMITAYCELHKLGYARSIECYLDKNLVGGIYGVQLGRVFFGESMFHTVANASKAVLVETAKQADIALIDCQIPNPHLESMGMVMIPKNEFMVLLNQWCEPVKPIKHTGKI